MCKRNFIFFWFSEVWFQVPIWLEIQLQSLLSFLMSFLPEGMQRSWGQAFQRLLVFNSQWLCQKCLLSQSLWFWKAEKPGCSHEEWRPGVLGGVGVLPLLRASSLPLRPDPRECRHLSMVEPTGLHPRLPRGITPAPQSHPPSLPKSAWPAKAFRKDLKNLSSSCFCFQPFKHPWARTPKSPTTLEWVEGRIRGPHTNPCLYTTLSSWAGDSEEG